MMIRQITLSFAVLSLGVVLHAAETAKDKYNMFPEPEKGYVRYIVEVPKTENDYDHKVELMIGKTMMVDCNHHSFSGKIEKFPLKGWGYSYYKVSDIRSGPTTMMAYREPKKEAFISIHLPPKWNSYATTVASEEKVHQAEKR